MDDSKEVITWVWEPVGETGFLRPSNIPREKCVMTRENFFDAVCVWTNYTYRYEPDEGGG